MPVFNPVVHTRPALALELAQLPDNFVVVGSVGRSALMGRPAQLERTDGTAVDIDVVNSQADPHRKLPKSGPFRVDSNMVRWLRPVSENSWGIFLPDVSDEPIAELDAEHFKAVEVAVPGEEAYTARVLPAGIQGQLMGLMTSPYRKHPLHRLYFERWLRQADSVHPEAAKAFTDFRLRRDQWAKQNYSTSERLYRQARSFYRGYAPRPVRQAVDRRVGPTVRKIRGTAR